MPKNPVFEKIRKEAYDQGFAIGFKYGKESATRFFAERFERLLKTERIGPKTIQRFMDVFGREYFEFQPTGDAAKSGRAKKAKVDQKADQKGSS
jgi:hypothetical protein